MKVFHPDIGMMSNYGEITGEIGRVIDMLLEGTDYTWFCGSCFLFEHMLVGRHYEFRYVFEIEDMKTGESKPVDKVVELLNTRHVEFRPRVLEGCPVCRRTRVEVPSGPERWGDQCPWCHSSRLFVFFVTGREDVRLFCETRQFQRPSMYGGLL